MPPWWGRWGRGRDIFPKARAGLRLRVPAQGRPLELALGPTVPGGGTSSFFKPAGRRQTGLVEPRHAPFPTGVSELVAREPRVTPSKGAGFASCAPPAESRTPGRVAVGTEGVTPFLWQQKRLVCHRKT